MRKQTVNLYPSSHTCLRLLGLNSHHKQCTPKGSLVGSLPLIIRFLNNPLQEFQFPSLLFFSSQPVSLYVLTRCQSLRSQLEYPFLTHSSTVLLRFGDSGVQIGSHQCPTGPFPHKRIRSATRSRRRQGFLSTIVSHETLVVRFDDPLIQEVKRSSQTYGVASQVVLRNL